MTTDGRLVNAVYGFLLVYLKVIRELKPSHLVVAFDRPEPTFRHEAYEAYKATREKQPDELYDQLPILKQVLAAMRVTVLDAVGFEADDVIGTVVTTAKRAGLASIIVTGDMDELQLVDEQVRVYTLRHGLSDTILYDVPTVQRRYGLAPSQLIDYRGLKGDPSDNLPGVKGVGEKTATLLIQKFQTLEGLYDALERGEHDAPLKPKLIERLVEHKADALMTRKLSIIRCDVPVSFSLDELVVEAPDTATVVALFQELQFSSLIAKLPGVNDAVVMAAARDSKATIPVQYKTITDDQSLQTLVAVLCQESCLAIATVTSGDEDDSILLGISFSWGPGLAAYVVLHDAAHRLDALAPLLTNSALAKWGHNVKDQYKVLERAGVTLAGLAGDTMLAAYLINPGVRAYDLSALSFTEFGHRRSRAAIAKKSKASVVPEVSLAELSINACEDADYTWRLQEQFLPKLKAHNLQALFDTIEVPLVPVLVSMEQAGVKIDVAVLKALEDRVAAQIGKREKEIFALTKTTFNIDSPRQLATVLFETLKLPTAGIGRTKSGYSTAAPELEKLKGTHEVIAALLDYRELTKLQSTYITALPKMVSPKSGRLHTTFSQVVAATGRLSSLNPNLQNIPVRSPLGAQVRSAFVAEPGNILISADYSQIELRIAASLSKDPVMLAIFQDGKDIHQATAARIHGISEAEVTKEIRATAKEVNFGVLYGMGAWGLAARTGLSPAAAREFIDRYFTTFAGLRTYLDELLVTAKKQGFVETLYGRRRYVPELSSGAVMVRQAGERIAVNMPIQGTAADMMKLAMIAVWKGLPSISPAARLVLQVHDELIIEAPIASVGAVGAFLHDEMIAAAKLSVPVVVNVAAGHSWGSLEAQ